MQKTDEGTKIKRECASLSSKVQKGRRRGETQNIARDH